MTLRLIYNLLLLILIGSFLYVWARLILLGLARWNIRRKDHEFSTKFPFIGVAILIISILSIAYLHYSMAVNAKEKVFANLKGLSGSYKLRINGQDVSNADSILTALSQIEDISAHHSHPTKSIQIEVEDKGKRFRLVLARDSERYTEYWVYYPEEDFTNDITTGQEIGRITTPLLNDY